MNVWRTNQRQAARAVDPIDDLSTDDDVAVERLRRDVGNPAAGSAPQITKEENVSSNHRRSSQRNLLIEAGILLAELLEKVGAVLPL